MVLDPRWVGAPPELVALIFEGGPGPGSIVAYAAVMATEAASHQMSMAVSATNIATTSSQWIGVAGAANVAKGTTLNMGGLQPLAAHCAKHVLLAQAAVDAYTMAAPSVIPSVACQANRDLWQVLCDTNFFGQNFPGITAQDIQYGEYWTQNSSVGVLYATTLNAIAVAAGDQSLLATSAGAAPAASMGSGVGLAGTAAQTAAQDAAQAPVTAQGAASVPTEATSQISSMLGQVPQAASALTQPATQALSAPTQAVQSLGSPLQSVMGMFMNANPGGATSVEAVGAEAIGGELAVGGGAAGGVGSGGAGAVGAGYSGAGLTSFTQPASTFEPEAGGRPTGRAGAFNAADLRSPTARPAGGSPMPMSPAGMLGHGAGASGKEKEDVTHARIVVGDDTQDPRRMDA
ncbi:PPE domain-containing protein [Mycobacterium sp.]|uniref:PPE domain-containing protein n=1 Tax=Mycobacterium sp. TaxID=1785 RepID=UPI003C740CC6